MADNANPIVHAVSASSGRRDLFDASEDDFLAAYGNSGSGSDDEEDPIDADEVFGALA
jgi:hypothetical protein